MKSYNMDDQSRKYSGYEDRIHTVRVTFQYYEYKGHIAYEVRGNGRGLDILNVEFDYMDNSDIESFIENDCSFWWNEDYECWNLILKDDNDNICNMGNVYTNEIGDYVVAVEIIECVR